MAQGFQKWLEGTWLTESYPWAIDLTQWCVTQGCHFHLKTFSHLRSQTYQYLQICFLLEWCILFEHEVMVASLPSKENSASWKVMLSLEWRYTLTSGSVTNQPFHYSYRLNISEFLPYTMKHFFLEVGYHPWEGKLISISFYTKEYANDIGSKGK